MFANINNAKAGCRSCRGTFWFWFLFLDHCFRHLLFFLLNPLLLVGIKP
jgi:hypothetical protein